VSCGKVCEEGLPKVKLKLEGEESWEGRVTCEQKIRGVRWVEVGGCTCCPGLTQAGWRRRGYSLRRDRRGMYMVRARNDGEQGKRCGLAGQSGPKSFTAAFLNILFENVLLCRILAVVWRRCWYTEAGNVSPRQQTPAKGGLSRRILRGG